MFSRRCKLLMVSLSCALGCALSMAVGSAGAAVPTIASVSFTEAGTSEVTFTATINPEGAATTYSFEYGETTAYGSSTPTFDLGAGSGTVSVRQQIEGLTPAGSYHFRAVATNASGTATSADATFTTFEPAFLGLPDGRGYEKVSSNDTANVYAHNQAFGNGLWSEQPLVAAANGDAIAYVGEPSEVGGNGHEGGAAGNQYVAKRAPGGGWTAVNVTPASGNFEEAPAYSGFSKNISAGYLSSDGVALAPDAPNGNDQYFIPYTRTFETGGYTALLTATPPNREQYTFGGYELPVHSTFGEREPIYAGSSADFKHILFFANDALTVATGDAPAAVDGGEEENNLYDSHDGMLSLVNVLPNGTTEPNATFGGPVKEPDVSEWNGNGPALTNDISEDGRRIYWTDLNNHNLYVRENGTRTVQVDAGVGGGGQYWTASTDGSKVLFTKAGDLYEYNVETEQTVDLTPGGEVQGIVGTSSDLSYIYFVADAALAANAKHVTCIKEPGTYSPTPCNLYALKVGESPRLVAQLSYGDDELEAPTPRRNGDWQYGAGNKAAEVTPDGKHLVFGSTQPLTSPDAASGSRKNVYEYNFEGPELFCVSCSPTGEPSEGSLPVSEMNTYLPRWMSSDGSRVFFASPTALVPQDTNGSRDVYEWEQKGSGSCTRAQGCIYLLSSGTSAQAAILADASESGDDVFIMTRAELVDGDGNQTVGLYDARVGATPPPAPAQCAGSGCQGAPLAPPVFATPSSATFNGVGNFPPQPKTVKPKVKKKPKKKPKRHSKKRGTSSGVSRGGSRAHRSNGEYGRGK